MPFLEVDAEGNPVELEDGSKNIIEDVGSWDLIKNHIPEEFKDSGMWENIQDTPTLLKNYAHAQKRMGSAINIPGEDASEEEKAAFLAKLGRPESPDKYDVKLPELPEDHYWNEEARAGFLKSAHEAGLSSAQVNKVLEWYGGWQRDVHVEGSRLLAEVSQQLQDEWGPNFESNTARTRFAVKHFGGEELQKVLDTTGLGNNPTLIKAFNRIGKLLQEDGVYVPQDLGSNADSINDQIQAIMNDNSHPYHKGDPESVEKVHKLYRMLHDV